jgi:hypothetical protein
MHIDFLHALSANLLSPAVLFFALGIAAALLRSDLKFPEALYVTLTIYLLTALGFKGGVAVHEAGIRAVILPALAAILQREVLAGRRCSRRDATATTAKGILRCARKWTLKPAGKSWAAV